MKKSTMKCLLIFSSFIILGFLVALIGSITLLGATTDSSMALSATILIIGSVLMSVSIFGTFVSSIVVLTKTSQLTVAKGLTKATAIVGIVGSSIAIIFVWALEGTAGSSIAFILLVVTFGLACGAYSAINRGKGFIDSNNNQAQPKQEKQDAEF